MRTVRIGLGFTWGQRSHLCRHRVRGQHPGASQGWPQACLGNPQGKFRRSRIVLRRLGICSGLRNGLVKARWHVFHGSRNLLSHSDVAIQCSIVDADPLPCGSAVSDVGANLGTEALGHEVAVVPDDDSLVHRRPHRFVCFLHLRFQLLLLLGLPRRRRRWRCSTLLRLSLETGRAGGSAEAGTSAVDWLDLVNRRDATTIDLLVRERIKPREACTSG
mmetsp:Transcript_125612/g.401708  ORF Transcript_125612/g.401708 Transcript_125612/m.401708 type:complete len:218 (+) Transcript_125612:492-1145(+)